LARQQYGDYHTEYSNAIGGLALVYKSQTRYAEAEPLYQRALAINEKNYRHLGGKAVPGWRRNNDVREGGSRKLPRHNGRGPRLTPSTRRSCVAPTPRGLSGGLNGVCRAPGMDLGWEPSPRRSSLSEALLRRTVRRRGLEPSRRPTPCIG
jgi:hypothetical protein